MRIILTLLLLLIAIPSYAIEFKQGSTRDACIAYYKLNDNLADTNIIDSIGDNDGTSNRNTILSVSAGTVNFSKHFNATDDEVDCGSDFVLTGADSICAWIKLRGFGTGAPKKGRIFGNGRTYFNVFDTNDRLEFTSNNSDLVISAVNSITLGSWHFVCVTRTSAGVANFYIDGVLSGAANQDSGSVLAGTGNIFIGVSIISSRFFDGEIDNIMFFNRVLGLKEIEALYNAGHGTESLFGLRSINTNESGIIYNPGAVSR